jgi:8-oxo-dGTP diphosphatase
VTLYLVRHAKAGSRNGFDGDDVDRPLSTAGWRQANALAERLAGIGPTCLVSSPYVRCVQTLEPLAALTDLVIAVDDRLAEEQPFEGVLALLADLPDGAVLCSHGDVIPATIDALVRRGMQLRNEPDWRKASTWLLHRRHGDVHHATVWPPPGGPR